MSIGDCLHGWQHDWHFNGVGGDVCYRCGSNRPYGPEVWAARDARIAELTAQAKNKNTEEA